MTSQQPGYEMPPPPNHSNSLAGWMPKAVIILGLALITAAIYGISVTSQKNALNTELTTVRSQLTITQNDLGSTRQI